MTSWFRMLLGILIIGLIALPLHASIESLKETSRAFNRVAQSALPGVVSISTSKDSRQPTSAFGDFFDDEFFRRFFRLPDPSSDAPRPRGLGSGVIVSPDGLILTNHHVIDGADSIRITLHDQRVVTAKLVGSDPKTDLAVLKIDAPNLSPVVFGNSDDIEVGDWAIAIGSPFGLSGSMTVGIISAKGRSDSDIADYTDFIQTDAAINRGNSGGALLSIDGQLIGINTAIFSATGGGNNGIGFAIPSNVAKKILTDIRSVGKVARGWLGLVIQPLTDALQQELNLASQTGALIGDVLPNSPAEKAGMKRRDVVISLNGQPIREHGDIKAKMSQFSVGDRLTLGLIRNGKSREVSIEVADLPNDAMEGDYDRFGLWVDDINDTHRHRYKIKRNEGVVIIKVADNSIAQKAGLKEGSVILELNDHRISTLSDYQHALARIGNPSRVVMAVASGRYAELYVLPVK